MSRPIALVCYICGRQFGTKSLGIHLKTCQKKWQAEQSLKPVKQRRPCPKAPPGLEALLSKPNITRQDVNSFNTGSFDTFKQQALMGCQYCGRKFNPKSLIPHQKACAKDPMVRKPYVSKNNANQQKQEESPMPVVSKGYNLSQIQDQGDSNVQLSQCNSCGRKFASDRISKHEKVCKGPQNKKPKQEVKTATKPNLKKNEAQDTKPAKWKKQHQDLQQAMKQMRKIKAIQQKGGDLSNLPPPPRSDYSHYIQCKYCGRKYAPDVAQKHIPKCANIINKPGGIKPSTIQSKYINGTGANSMKSPVKMPALLTNNTVNPSVKSASKPNMIAKSGLRK